MEKAVEMTKYLESGAAFAARHDELEAFIAKDGQELLRRLQGTTIFARSRSARFESKAPTAWCAHSAPELAARGEPCRQGGRRAHRVSGAGRRGASRWDAALNLPPELYSHAVRRRAAEHAAAASFEVSASLRATTGAAVLGKRQAEELAARAAQDFDEFYATRKMTVEKTNDLLVLTFDGKGIPMRREI
ncbi:MAG: hypothetical protein U0235_22605 [Polyangiaceae bacterium]